MDANSIFILASIFVCFTLLAVTILYFYGPKPVEEKLAATEQNMSFDRLMHTISSPRSTMSDLEMAVELFFKFYDTMELDNLQKKNFLFALALHKNIKAQLILKAEKQLKELNPKIATELEHIVKKAVDMRGL